MKTIILLTCAALALGGSAQAAGRAPVCRTLAVLKADAAKVVAAAKALSEAEGSKEKPRVAYDTFVKLSPAMFHFAEGSFFVLNSALPKADSALLATVSAKDDDGAGALFWMQGELVCGHVTISKAYVNALKGIKDAPGETGDGI